MADNDLADIRKQCMASLYQCSENVLKYMDEERDSELAMLKNCVREYCAMEATQDLEAQALATVIREADVSSVNSLDDRYNAYLHSLQEKRRQNIDNHPFMLEFEKIIRNGQLNHSQNLDESDIAITATQEVFYDPITMKPIEDPVQSALCGHVYERAAILSHIQSRARARCPVAGCGSREPLDASQLSESEALRMRVRASRLAASRLADTDSQ